MSGARHERIPVLEVEALSKSFGGVRQDHFLVVAEGAG